MRIASALGVILAVVIGMLAITQVSNLEDSIVSNTSGALSSFSDNLTFLWVLVLVILASMAVVGAFFFRSR